jgi:hypothetical protein
MEPSQSPQAFIPAAQIPKMILTLPSGDKTAGVPISIISPTDSTASTPRSENSLASSDISSTFYGIQSPKRGPEYIDWTMHPITIARDSFL